MKSFVSNRDISSWSDPSRNVPFIQKKTDSFLSNSNSNPPFIQPRVDISKVSKRNISNAPKAENMVQMSGDLGTYQVESGDTFASVAKKLSITVQQLAALNPKKYKFDAKNNRVTDLSGSVAKLSDGVILKVPSTAKLKVGKGDTGKLKYVQIAGQAFVKGGSDGHVVDPNDVDQGDLGDCSLMSGMAAIAKANPAAIHGLIKPLGKGKYAVTLYVDSGGLFNYKVKRIEIVSNYFPASGSSPEYAQTTGDSKGNVEEIWPMLLEKALAQYLGGYDKIENKNAGTMMEYLTGKEYSSFKVASYSEIILLLVIKQALNNKQPITAGTKKSIPADLKKKDVVENHSYAPLKVNSGNTLNLYNPHGHTHLNKFTMPDFKKGFDNIQIMKK